MHDILPHIIFYIFAGLTVASAVMVITQSNPVRSILFLVLAFFASAVLWILMSAEFLALILVLVYVGAVMTLFLFVVMMLNIDIESMKKHLIRYLTVGLVIVALLVSIMIKAIPMDTFKAYNVSSADVIQTTSNRSTDDFALPLSNTEALGMVLYTDYVLAFELAAAILLVAIIAAITLAHRAPRQSKRQNILRQIMTRRDDRVKLVKMKSEQV